MQKQYNNKKQNIDTDSDCANVTRVKKQDEKFIKRQIRLILCVMAIFIFVMIVEEIFENDIYYFDTFIYQYVSKLLNPTLTQIALVFTNIGDIYVILPIC